MAVLIFDWDGTLHDTAHLYGHALRAVCRNLEKQGFGSACPSDEEASAWLGLSIAEMWHQFRPDLPESVWKQAAAQVGEGMEKGIAEGLARMYPQAAETLSRLKDDGHTLVVLSNCTARYMEAHKKYFHLEQWFSAFFCCEEYNKPKEAVVPLIRECFPGKVVLIGDRASDRMAAQSNHLPFIGCLYGFGMPNEMQGADQTIKTIDELPEKLCLLVTRRK